MLTEGAWRKLPKDLLVDEDFSYVESLLPPEYGYAPYMFYIAALRKADDNGIFDVEDFEIFARLMRVDDVEIVKKVVNALIKRHVIYHECPDSTLCGFWRWEHGEGTNKPRPLAERRKIVMNKIQEQRAEANRAVQFGDSATPESRNVQAGDSSTHGNQTAPDASAAEKSNVFLCPVNDKNAENVVNEKMDDKTAENVVKKNQTEREKERESEKDQIRPEEKEKTHTLEQREERETEKEGSPGSGQLESPPPDTPEKTEAVAHKDYTDSQEQNSQTESFDDSNADSSSNLAVQALQAAGLVDGESETLVAGKLEKFFAENCLGYDKKQGAHSVFKIAKKICALADEMNPADTICDIVCAEFKRMRDNGGPNGYWKNIPLLPSNMLKNGVWAYLMSYAGKILTGRRNSNQFLDEAKKAQEEAEKESAQVCDEMSAAYLKYGIDPKDPNRNMLLLRAKAAENKAKEAAQAQVKAASNEWAEPVELGDSAIF